MSQKIRSFSILFLSLILCGIAPGFAQLGNHHFEFANKSPNARVSALGGVNTTVSDGDVNMHLQNPALLDTSMAKKASINYHKYYANAAMFGLAYAHDFKNVGVLGFGFTYLNYGKMDELDPSGNIIGSFSANEYALSVSKSFVQNAFSFGVKMQVMGSQIASYNALGMSVDLGTTFRHPDKDLSVSVVLKHIGFGIKNYSKEKITMPFDAQVGLSIKPQSMPIRFSITAHHLHDFGLAYHDPNFNTQGLSPKKKPSFAEELSRHFIFGSEILISKAFHLRFGYNRQVSKDLGSKNGARGAGLSIGMALKIRSYELGYTRSMMHTTGGRNFLTISKSF